MTRREYPDPYIGQVLVVCLDQPGYDPKCPGIVTRVTSRERVQVRTLTAGCEDTFFDVDYLPHLMPGSLTANQGTIPAGDRP